MYSPDLDGRADPGEIVGVRLLAEPNRRVIDLRLTIDERNQSRSTPNQDDKQSRPQNTVEVTLGLVWVHMDYLVLLLA